jgi:hypothetical protein
VVGDRGEEKGCLFGVKKVGRRILYVYSVYPDTPAWKVQRFKIAE